MSSGLPARGGGTAAFAAGTASAPPTSAAVRMKSRRSGMRIAPLQALRELFHLADRQVAADPIAAARMQEPRVACDAISRPRAPADLQARLAAFDGEPARDVRGREHRLDRVLDRLDRREP